MTTMLSEAERELILLAVDRELSADDEPTFAAVVRRSPEAAALYARLCADRDRLRSLPRHHAPTALTNALTNTIQRQLQPIEVRRSRTASSYWLPIATAAAILCAIATGTFWLTSVDPSPRPTSTAHQLEQLPISMTTLAAPAAKSIPVIDDDVPPTLTKPQPSANVIAQAEPAPSPTPTVEPKEQPKQLPNQTTILAAPVGEDAKPFDLVKLRLPVLASFADLSRDEVQQQLREQLTREAPTRIDLFARDTIAAAELIAASAKTANITLVTEYIAAERMRRRMPSTWVIYTDAIPNTDLVKWLVATADRDGKSHPQGVRNLQQLHAITAGPQEQKLATDLFAIDLGLNKRTRSEAPTTTAPLSAGTLNQVATSLAKTEPTHAVLLVTHLPQTVRAHPQLSKDIRFYHELRRDQKANHPAVMLVIRPMP